MADFSVDTDICAIVKQQSLDAARRVEEIKADIEATLKSIGPEGDEDWVGDSFNSFNSMCSQFLPAFDSLVELLKAMGEVIGTHAVEDADTLENSLESALG